MRCAAGYRSAAAASSESAADHPVAELHRRLLTLPKQDQQGIIAQLSQEMRRALTEYARSLEAELREVPTPAAAASAASAPRLPEPGECAEDPRLQMLRARMQRLRANADRRQPRQEAPAPRAPDPIGLGLYEEPNAESEDSDASSDGVFAEYLAGGSSAADAELRHAEMMLREKKQELELLKLQQARIEAEQARVEQAAQIAEEARQDRLAAAEAAIRGAGRMPARVSSVPVWFDDSDDGDQDEDEDEDEEDEPYGSYASKTAKEALAAARRSRASLKALLREQDDMADAVEDTLQDALHQANIIQRSLDDSDRVLSMYGMQKSGDGDDAGPAASKEAEEEGDDNEDWDSAQGCMGRAARTAGRPTATFHAMMRYLRTASPEERRAAIAAMPQDRFLELLGFMDKEGVGSLPQASDLSDGEDALGSSGVGSILDSGSDHDADYDVDDDRFEADTGDSDEASDSEESVDFGPATPSHASTLGGFGTVCGGKPEVPPCCVSQSSVLCVSYSADSVERNTQPLGKLQVEGDGAQSRQTSHVSMVTLAPWCLAASDDDGGDISGALAETGVYGEAIRAWLSGEISAGLCRAQMLEAVGHSKFCEAQGQRELCRTAELYRESGAGIGGCLGALVGGFAGVAAFGPAGAGSVLEQAAETAIDSAASALHVSIDDDGLAMKVNPEAMNFEFRRQCLQAHPQRELGNFLSYLQVHTHLEIVRQCVSIAQCPSRPNAMAPPFRTDIYSEVEAEFDRSDDDSAKAAKSQSPEDLETWNERVSRYILDLRKQKELMEKMLEQLKAGEAFAVLGVLPTATDAEVAKAYKVLAIRLHPDKGGDAEQFKALRAAYERILEARRGSKKGNSSSRPASPKKGEAATAAPAKEDPDAAKAAAAEEPAPNKSSEEEKEEKKEKESEPATGEDPEKAAEKASADTEEPAEEESAEVDGETAADEEPEAEAVPEDVSAEAQSGDTTASNDERSPRTEEESDGGSDSPSGPASRACRDSAAGCKTAAEREAQAAKVIDAIPVEAISRQAEHALDGAEMCARVAKLAEEAAVAGRQAWPQLIRCGTHLLDSAHCVTEATRSVAQVSVGTPSDVLPLLERIKKAKGVTAQIINQTRELMHCTEVISERGIKTANLSDRLLVNSKGLIDALKSVSSHITMSEYAARTLAETLRNIANIARDAADAAASTAVTVGDAQRHAQTLVEMLNGSDVDEEDEEKEKAEKEKKDGSSDAETDDSSDDEAPETPLQRRVTNRRLLQKMNSEVLSLQREMRLLVASNPQLLPVVSVAQKEHIFALVAELVQRFRRSVSQAWRAGATGGTAVAWLQATEAALALVKSAGDWDRLASPSFEARILRTAALIDAGHLSKVLRGELLDHCMALAPEHVHGAEVAGAESLKDLGARFSVAVQALCKQDEFGS